MKENKTINQLTNQLIELISYGGSESDVIHLITEQLAFYRCNQQIWQPIETAPRYGRILVLTREIGMCVASAGWDNDTPDKIRWEVINSIVVEPTHWMPLPVKPE